MVRKCGKMLKIANFWRKIVARFLSVRFPTIKKIVYSITLLYSSTFYSSFLPFFVLETFKFKYDMVFIRHSASIHFQIQIIWTAVLSPIIIILCALFICFLFFLLLLLFELYLSYNYYYHLIITIIIFYSLIIYLFIIIILSTFLIPLST